MKQTTITIILAAAIIIWCENVMMTLRGCHRQGHLKRQAIQTGAMEAWSMVANISPRQRKKPCGLLLWLLFAAITCSCWFSYFWCNMFTSKQQRKDGMASRQRTNVGFDHFFNPLFCWERWTDPINGHHLVQTRDTSCRLAAMMQKAWHPPHFRQGSGVVVSRGD